jgi:NAD(P)-dependent dehydrogenase (short-subunit alcohol dehydrogenase family)
VFLTDQSLIQVEDDMSAGRKIEGRVALVTGSNRGIGRALVEALLARGVAKVYAAARRTESLTALVAQAPGRVVPLRLDVTQAVQVRQAATQAGDVDLLVNNAAILGHAFAGFEDPIWLDAARQEYETNVVGALRVSQAFAPVLARNGGGTIVNVSSVAGLVGMPPVLTYSSTKAALHSLTQSTRQMLRDQGTRVVGVYPGPVETEMASELPLEKTSPEAVAANILDGLELGREEIYPDPFAAAFATTYATDPKAVEQGLVATPAAAK